MGATNSKIEEDKAFVLCRERKHFVRQAIDFRCSLADAHVAYIESLRNVGIAFKKFVDPEASIESSRNASTLPTIDPISQLSKFPSLSNLEETLPLSPAPPPFSSGQFHVNHMKAGKTSYMTVQEKPPISLTTTLHMPQSDEISSFESPNAPAGTQPWDYFGLRHPINNQLRFQNGRGLDHEFENSDDIICLKQEEGISDLEEEDRASTDEKNELDSEDDFEQTSNEPLVQIFRNRNMVTEHQFKRESAVIQSMNDLVSETKSETEDDMKQKDSIFGVGETPERTPAKVVVFPLNGRSKESYSEAKHEAKDFVSCMKEIEDLFQKASESGSEVPRMLEANKVQFRPMFPEGKAHRSKAGFGTSFFVCCKEGTPHDQAPITSEVKYLIWDRSVSLLSRSSGNFPDQTTKDDIKDLNGNLFSSTYMNSGSHASTLDRLYAWERKLYDEVKASGIIRREYDMKCRLLRQKESTRKNLETTDNATTDKTRAVVKDLHYRIRVAIQRIDSISKKIEEITDKELQPQLEELIEGLTRMWRMMLDYHKHQLNIISLVSNNDRTKVSTPPISEDQARVLEIELKSLCLNFTEWMSAHKSYLEAIYHWLFKCVRSPKQKSSWKKQVVFCPKRDIAPPIFVTCQDWLVLLDKMPTKELASAINDLVTVIAHFVPHQEKGHRSSKILFSLPQEAGQNGKLEEHADHSHVNWSLKYDNLVLALKEFLSKLKTFAQSSVSEYEALHLSINVAQDRYEKTEFKLALF
ncbi:hypothetical protein Cni_G13294 [Canna indica]|uniref:Nitrate regulatory gene2 protein-like n=1 Tax=Canna indica TaxID=4628 RepID=A0AAQ3QCZ2_9LILI|nr:hypothetical protein Cni_G13294 [Canna indica]